MPYYPTQLHRIAATAKRVLPRSLVMRLRGITTTLATPILWTLHTSHWRSGLAGMAVDADGPLPWYTYPSINLLQAAELTGLKVLEFGAGNSTLWWASRAAHVVALESDADWFSFLSKQSPSNVSLHLVTDNITEASTAICTQGAPYDVIAVDGLDRSGFALLSQDWLTENGAIIYDNSDVCWGSDVEGIYPVIDAFHSAGFQRVDFYGHAPNASLPHCTSIFFRVNCFLFSSAAAPRDLQAWRLKP